MDALRSSAKEEEEGVEYYYTEAAGLVVGSCRPSTCPQDEMDYSSVIW